MQIKSSQDGARSTLSLSGRLDTNSSRQLEEAIGAAFEQVFQELVLDMSDLEYISSAGLRVLLGALKRCRSAHAGMKVVNACEAVLEVFEITGFSSFLVIE